MAANQCCSVAPPALLPPCLLPPCLPVDRSLQRRVLPRASRARAPPPFLGLHPGPEPRLPAAEGGALGAAAEGATRAQIQHGRALSRSPHDVFGIGHKIVLLWRWHGAASGVRILFGLMSFPLRLVPASSVRNAPSPLPPQVVLSYSRIWDYALKRAPREWQHCTLWRARGRVGGGGGRRGWS